ncbi:MAG: alpha/beta fold hydrolase, partial [Myxococcales bacterium]|nr:alpha/beta fold hydrolase [Myxococcales bacterium]
GAEVIYGEAAGLRTLELAPRAGATVELVFLPGLPYESVDHALREGHATARFLADLARTGVASLRIERPGLGDSPGAPCHGFLDEQRAYRDALDARPRTRPRVLFGHSVGGMHAPMLADLADGLIVYGTSARRWSDCLAASRDRQRALHGLDPLAGPVGWPSERNKQFHEELDAVDLDAVWRSVDLPKLVVIGEHDWVVGEADQRALGGEALFLEGLDHAFASHPSKDESLAQYGRGSYDERVATGCAEWLARAITSPGASR